MLLDRQIDFSNKVLEGNNLNFLTFKEAFVTHPHSIFHFNQFYDQKIVTKNVTDCDFHLFINFSIFETFYIPKIPNCQNHNLDQILIDLSVTNYDLTRRDSHNELSYVQNVVSNS